MTAADAVPGADDRGQTTLDYAVGVGIFLVAVAGVVAFVPGMLDPFAGTQEDVSRADRLAETLAADLLGDPAEPYRLEDDCTRAFFDAAGDGDDGLGCRFDADGADLDAALHVAGSQLNVTIEGPGDVAKTDLDGDGAAEPLAVGPTPPDRGSVAVAQRAVSFEGETHRLLVRVW